MKIGNASTFREAREAATLKWREDMRIVERKMLFGAERTFTIVVVPDPHCKGCHGEGDEWLHGIGHLCYCVTTGRIINEKKSKRPTSSPLQPPSATSSNGR